MEESKRYHIRKQAWSICGWAAIVLAVLCMLGLVVALIMLGLGNEHIALLGILCGAFAGGALLCGLSGFFSVRRGEFWFSRELDALERADSEDSFFVGEDTMVTFGEGAALLHNSERSVSVPYAEMRFFSVCNRRKPREKGEWSVLMEVPASYVMKKTKKGEPPVLVRTEGKPRLYAVLQKYGLTLLGEQRGEEARTRFTKLRTFSLPDRAKRKKSLWLMLLGVAVAGAGVGLLFYIQALGAPVIVVGGYIVLRALASYLRAKRVFAVYREGLYLAELTLRDSFFLKWEEIVSLVPAEAEKQEILRAHCLYGAYDFPRPEGAYEYLKEQFPGKCGEGHMRGEGEGR